MKKLLQYLYPFSFLVFIISVVLGGMENENDFYIDEETGSGSGDGNSTEEENTRDCKNDKQLEFDDAVRYIGQYMSNDITDLFSVMSEAYVRQLQNTAKDICISCSQNSECLIRWPMCDGNSTFCNCIEIKITSSESLKVLNIKSWNCSRDGKVGPEGQDGFSCPSTKLDRLGEEFFSGTSQKEKTVNESTTFLEELSNQVAKQNGTTDVNFKYNGTEIPKILNWTASAVVLIDESATFNETEAIGKKALTTVSTLLTNEKPWNDVKEEERPRIFTGIIEKIESVAFNLIRRDGFEVGQNETYLPLEEQGEDKNAVLVSMGRHTRTDNINNESTIHFPETSAEDAFITVRVTEDLYKSLNIKSTTISYVGAIVKSKYIENILNFTVKGENGTETTKKINGKLLSFTLNDTLTAVNLPDNFPAVIVFKHTVEAIGEKAITFRRRRHPGEARKAILGESVCAFQNNQSLWSTDGCKKILEESNFSFTTCQCNHLTSFAVLTGFHDYVGKDFVLEILTWVLSGASILCLIITVIIFNTVNPIRTDQIKITSNLCISLLFANLVLLLGDKDNTNFSDSVCLGIGVINHYLWLCVFGWMAVEGIHLYHKVVQVFRSTNLHLFKMYYAVGYGFPCIIVSITAGIGYSVNEDNVYVGEMYCWLKGNYVWTFMGPALVVVTGNFCILVHAIRLATRKIKDKIIKSKSRKEEQAKAKATRKLIQGAVSLSLILGITWGVGFFTMADIQGAVVFSYIFTVLNASQGVFIFVFHCLLNETIRSSLSKIITSRISTASRSTNSTQ